MRKFKLLLIFIQLALIELIFIFLSVFTYNKRITSGQINSITDFIFESHFYLSFIPFLFGVSGIFIKRQIGWILTISVFYFLLITGFAAAISTGLKTFFEIFTFILCMGFIITPIIILNGNILREFYKIKTKKNFIIENIIAIGMMLICSLLLFKFNG